MVDVEESALVTRSVGADAPESSPPSEPCVMLVFGASGDLTRRLLVPALYNLACDGLLSENFALLGTAMDPLTTESFRARMTRGHQEVPHAQGVRPEGLGRPRRPLPLPPGHVHRHGRLRASPGRGEGARREACRAGERPLLLRRRRRGSSGCICDNLHASGFKAGTGLEANHRREALRHRSPVGAASSTPRSWRTGTRTRSTASTTTSERRRSRTSSPSASPTGCSSRSGTRTTSTTSSSTSPRPSTSRGAAATTTRPACCGT